MTQGQPERRDYRRVQASYPVTLIDETGQELYTKTINLSDGGALVSVPFSDAPAVGQVFSITLTLPPSASVFRLERTVRCKGMVVRHQDIDNPTQIGIAIVFSSPLKLALP